MGWGTGNIGNGSGGLNLKIVGGTSEPSNPRENTIWVNTDQKITSWIFSAAEPDEPEEGIVWISTGTSSTVAFNALKKNGIQIHLIYTKQYINSAWVRKNTKIYQSGEWTDLWSGRLFDVGNEYTEITGGWELEKQIDQSDIRSVGGLTTSGYLYSSTKNTFNFVHTKKPIDLTGFNSLKANIYYINSSYRLYIAVLPFDTDWGYDSYAARELVTAKGLVSLDISNLGDKYYVAIGCYDNSGDIAEIDASEVYLE